MKHLVYLILFGFLFNTSCSSGAKNTAGSTIPRRPAAEVWNKDYLKQNFGTCELTHLTEKGYLALVPVPFLVKEWDQDLVYKLVQDAGKPTDRNIRIRSTFHLQMAHASSVQAARVYYKLWNMMKDQGVVRLDREALSREAWRAHIEKYQAQFPAAEEGVNLDSDVTAAYQKMPGCGIVKWLNKKPDVFAQPVSPAARSIVANLFSDDSVVRTYQVSNQAGATSPFSEREQQEFAYEGSVDADSIYELRAIRLASQFYERQFAILYNDKGGWDGNKKGRAQKLVCTDEAATQYAFIRFYLEDTGLLKNFHLEPNSRFAFRRPKVFGGRVYSFFANKINDAAGITDHFGVILVHNRTGKKYVLDSWVEDGGIPPHIATLEDWVNKREKSNVVSIGNAEIDGYLAHKKAPDSDDQVLAAQADGIKDFRQLILKELETQIPSPVPAPANAFDPTQSADLKKQIKNIEGQALPDYSVPAFDIL